MKLSVIIPTIGRPTLKHALRSAYEADEIIVVGDEAGAVASLPSYCDLVVRGGDHGYAARTAGMKAATGTHLAFLDDDDVWTTGAARAFRRAAADVPVIFRMLHPQHGVLWRTPTLAFGNVGTPMFVVPNRPDDLGEWVPFVPGLAEPGGDFSFVSGCCERMGEPMWEDDLVAIVRPQALREEAA